MSVLAAAKKPGAKAPHIAVVKAEGHVDVAGIEACDWLVASAGEKATGAVVDLTGATHVEYRSAPVLVHRRRVLRARGAELAIAAGKREVRDALRAGGGIDLPVFVTMDEAMAWVRGEGDTVAAVSASKVRSR